MINSQLVVPRAALEECCRRRHVKRLSLFGSATRSDFTPASDVDVLVEFEEGARVSLFDHVDMQMELSTLFGHRRVDLATPSILRNPFRRAAILKDLETIYVAPGS